MLPKAHLTLHSKMSGSMSVITPSWLSGSLTSFFFSYNSVYSCHLFLISSASVRYIPFLSYIVPIFVPLLSPLVIFLKRTLVFLILLFSSILCIIPLRRHVSSCYSLELCIQLSISFSFLLVFGFSSFLSYL